MRPHTLHSTEPGRGRRRSSHRPRGRRARRGPAAATPVIGLAVVIVLSSVVVPGSVAAQAVAGRVVTDDGGVPVPGALISLMTEAGVQVDSARTDGAGRYRLRAGTAGTYRLYVALEGYASQSTTPFELAAGRTVDREVRYNLVSIQAMHAMGDVVASDSMLQQDLPKICGEALRPWESGLIVGVIRDRSTSRPIPGAVVTVQPPATPDSTPAPRTTVSNKHGTYIFCNIPEGDDITLRVRAPGRPLTVEKVRVRKGMIGWYDVYVRGS